MVEEVDELQNVISIIHVGELVYLPLLVLWASFSVFLLFGCNTNK